jgi:hypothetical protein
MSGNLEIPPYVRDFVFLVCVKVFNPVSGIITLTLHIHVVFLYVLDLRLLLFSNHKNNKHDMNSLRVVQSCI